ncbi:MAG: hypothetical protein EOO86_05620 [Pedobacter sp.]|nr:MAG: hypothetical protein EOO86_05620 [Pedobacter sp.]
MSTLNSVKLIWHQQISSALADFNVECHFFLKENFSLLSISNGDIIVHLVNLDHQLNPNDLLKLQDEYAAKGIKIVHLWEDVWFSRPSQVLARIQSLLGNNKRIYGRKTKVQKIDKSVAESFLNDNHLQGFVSSRYKLGLFEKENLVAVATFSALRKMNHSANYKSAELIRFAVKAGYSVTGGLSKLITYFSEQYSPNDLMTYADRDWSAGEAYIKLGFEQTAILVPQYFNLNDDLSRNIMKGEITSLSNAFNTGSLKYILKFQHD